MVVKASSGPIPFPNLERQRQEAERLIAQRRAEVEAYRSMAVLAGSAQWPQIKSGLTNHLTACMEKLLNETEHREVIRLQERVKAYRDLLAAPEQADRHIADLGREIEALQKRLESSVPPKN